MPRLAEGLPGRALPQSGVSGVQELKAPDSSEATMAWAAEVSICAEPLAGRLETCDHQPGRGWNCCFLTIIG